MRLKSLKNMSCSTQYCKLSKRLSFFFVVSERSEPKTKVRISFQRWGSSVTTSWYIVSKSFGLSLKAMIQVDWDLIRAGIIVYFYDITAILNVPFAIRCLLLKNSALYLGLFSFIFMSLTTSSSTSKTFICVRSCSSGCSNLTNWLSIMSASSIVFVAYYYSCNLLVAFGPVVTFNSFPSLLAYSMLFALFYADA